MQRHGGPFRPAVGVRRRQHPADELDRVPRQPSTSAFEHDGPSGITPDLHPISVRSIPAGHDYARATCDGSLERALTKLLDSHYIARRCLYRRRERTGTRSFDCTTDLVPSTPITDLFPKLAERPLLELSYALAADSKLLPDLAKRQCFVWPTRSWHSRSSPPRSTRTCGWPLALLVQGFATSMDFHQLLAGLPVGIRLPPDRSAARLCPVNTLGRTVPKGPKPRGWRVRRVDL